MATPNPRSNNPQPNVSNDPKARTLMELSTGLTEVISQAPALATNNKTGINEIIEKISKHIDVASKAGLTNIAKELTNAKEAFQTGNVMQAGMYVKNALNLVKDALGQAGFNVTDIAGKFRF